MSFPYAHIPRWTWCTNSWDPGCRSCWDSWWCRRCEPDDVSVPCNQTLPGRFYLLIVVYPNTRWGTHGIHWEEGAVDKLGSAGAGFDVQGVVENCEFGCVLAISWSFDFWLYIDMAILIWLKEEQNNSNAKDFPQIFHVNPTHAFLPSWFQFRTVTTSYRFERDGVWRKCYWIFKCKTTCIYI